MKGRHRRGATSHAVALLLLVVVEVAPESRRHRCGHASTRVAHPCSEAVGIVVDLRRHEMEQRKELVGLILQRSAGEEHPRDGSDRQLVQQASVDGGRAVLRARGV